ncbi:MAG: endonuclease III [Firmicutes bacterium]|nr:endonuclease III [Bacillota bacterium]
MKKPAETRRILKLLGQAYPARSGLRYQTPFQLLAAAMLSAQSTDVQVNRVTERLFQEFPDPPSMAAASEQEVQELIRGVGLHDSKSRYLVEASRIIMERYGGQVPRTREELMLLPGVGRKTANVVLSNAFGVPAIAVDTHVFRVSNRIGLASGKNVLETEKQLEASIPPNTWGKAHHWLIWHGREVCRARSPLCDSCLINSCCDYFLNKKH